MTFGGILWRVALVAVLAVVAGAVALAVSKRQKKEYQASTSLIFESYAQPELAALGGGFGIGGNDPDRRTLTLAELVSSRNVAVRVAQQYPGLHYNAGQIHGLVSAKPAGPSDMIKITARSDSPQRAALLANSYRHAFNTMRLESERRRANRAIGALEQELATLAPRLRNSAEGETLREQIGRLSIISRLGTGTPIVAEGAYAQASAVAPQTKRNVLFALLFGALIGVGLIVLRTAALAQRRGSPEAQQRDVGGDWE